MDYETYVSETLPRTLLVTKGYGITRKEIDEGCPSDFEPYEEAYRLSIRQSDESNWMLGMYVNRAVAVAIEHCFNGKKAQSKYVEHPFMKDFGKADKPLTEQDIIEQTKALFGKLELMKTNFELTHEE